MQGGEKGWRTIQFEFWEVCATSILILARLVPQALVSRDKICKLLY